MAKGRVLFTSIAFNARHGVSSRYECRNTCGKLRGLGRLERQMQMLVGTAAGQITYS